MCAAHTAHAHPLHDPLEARKGRRIKPGYAYKSQATSLLLAFGHALKETLERGSFLERVTKRNA